MHQCVVNDTPTCHGCIMHYLKAAAQTSQRLHFVSPVDCSRRFLSCMVFYSVRLPAESQQRWTVLHAGALPGSSLRNGAGLFLISTGSKIQMSCQKCATLSLPKQGSVGNRRKPKLLLLNTQVCAFHASCDHFLSSLLTAVIHVMLTFCCSCCH